MKKKILFSLRSPYREQLDVVGYSFGHGEKSLAIVGAMRGNEVQQMYVCSRMVQELKKLESEGRIADDKSILVVPCVNYYSMNIGKRFWAMDNTDINRMFPGFDQGETTQRIADGVFQKLQGYEYGIQLASFYQPGNFLPHVKIMDTGFTDPDIMKDFGLEFGIIRKPRPYDTTTLNYNWQVWETKAFSVYANATDEIDEHGAEEAVNAILRFMNNRGIVSVKTPPGYITDILDESVTRQVRSEHAGVFFSMTEIGRRVERGDLLGRITDPFDGELVSEIRSPVSGTVYFEYHSPLINGKTVCFKIIT
ncbi:M14 family metallopeptidase [Ruminococcus sp. NK3A76]|uniref:M14 family metallopeptidase n=1 Tax=Ruminococcus sp. NK3A76 TaxID=877411 RepID=UPI00048AE374|nr:M14 family metallopeptidase [Ruminococcus sp. NK3A76]